jgi:hypothetical protein
MRRRALNSTRFLALPSRRAPYCAHARSAKIRYRAKIQSRAARRQPARRAASRRSPSLKPRAGEPPAGPHWRVCERRVAAEAARRRRPPTFAIGAVDGARAARPDKSEGGRRLWFPNTSRRAISRRRSTSWRRAFAPTSATRCCSASSARARLSPWPKCSNDAAPGAHSRAEQDLDGPPLRGVRELLSGQCGRV